MRRDELLQLIARRGMGVRRKSVPLTRAHAGRDPVFVATDDVLRVVLPAADVSGAEA